MAIRYLAEGGVLKMPEGMTAKKLAKLAVDMGEAAQKLSKKERKALSEMEELLEKKDPSKTLRKLRMHEVIEEEERRMK